MPYRFVVDKHVDPTACARLLSPASVTAADGWKPRSRYVGPEPNDEDRAHVLQLAFERDATLLTSDGGLLVKAVDFGPCGSRGSLPGRRDRAAARQGAAACGASAIP